MAARQHQNRPHDGSVFGTPDPDTFVSNLGEADEDRAFAPQKRTPLAQPKVDATDAPGAAVNDSEDYSSEHLNIDRDYKDRSQSSNYSEGHKASSDNGTSQNLAWDDLGLVHAPQPADSPLDILPNVASLDLSHDSYSPSGASPVAGGTGIDVAPDDLLFSSDYSPETGTATLTGAFEVDAPVVEVGDHGFTLPLTVDDAKERFGHASVFEDEGVTQVDVSDAMPMAELGSEESTDQPEWPTLGEMANDSRIVTLTEPVLISVSEAEAERFHQDVAAETWQRLSDQRAEPCVSRDGLSDHKPEFAMDVDQTLSPTQTPVEQGQDAAESIAIIESRNTSTREVVLTPEEFALAQQQIVENGFINIPGKAVVLEAVAITRHPADGSTPRRRRRRA